MTIVETMDNIADYLRAVLADYTISDGGTFAPVSVYAGWPPVRDSSKIKESFVYACVTDWQDDLDGTNQTSKATVQIGFSVQDADLKDGWRQLYNLMETVRQALLRKRTIAGRSWLQSPVKGMVVVDNLLFPEWSGAITVQYVIGQPVEEKIGEALNG